MTTSTKVRNRVLGLMAFGLLATTALTANFMVTPSLPVHAETNQQVAPQAGFADIAAKAQIGHLLTEARQRSPRHDPELRSRVRSVS